MTGYQQVRGIWLPEHDQPQPQRPQPMPISAPTCCGKEMKHTGNTLLGRVWQLVLVQVPQMPEDRHAVGHV